MAINETLTKKTHSDQVKPSQLLSDRKRDIRKVKPIDDMMGIQPNKVSTSEPEFIHVDPKEVYIDGTYQRDVTRQGMKLILNIIENFSWSKFKPPVLTRDDKDRLIAIDGQHTLIGAASHPEIKRIPAIFIPLKSVEDQASSFVSHNTAKVNVPVMDLFFAQLAQKDQTTMDIYNVLVKNGIELLRFMSGATTGSYEPNTTMAIGALKEIYRKHGKAKLDNILAMCAECGFTPIRRDHLIALKELLYGRKEERGEIDQDLLIETIKSLNDTTSRMRAASIASTTQVSQAIGLAIFWRNQYYRLYAQ
jgi:hypothetical protein